MKKLIIVVALILGSALLVAAQQTASVTLKTGQQKAAGRTGIKLKLIAVTNDSRCPADAKCVWAGNAVVKFEIVDRRGHRRTFEANTNVEPKGGDFADWAVKLVKLTPEKRSDSALDPRNYTARFMVRRSER